MKKFIRFILGVITVLIIAYLIIVSLPKAKIDSADVDFVLSAIELYEHYQDDETNANDTYLGKVIEVQGTIQLIETDQSGATVLVLNVNDGFGGVMCTLAENPKEELYEVNQQVTVKGLCAGKLMDVVLNKCVVVYA